MFAFKHKKGFTFIEILVVIAILFVIATITVVGFQNYTKHAALTVGTQEVYTMLRDARVTTLASEDALVYGVHLSTSTVTRFTGSTYSAGNANNKTYTFEYGVTATGTLPRTGANVIFTRLTGTPSATGTIFLVSADGNATRTVTIHASGLIEY